VGFINNKGVLILRKLFCCIFLILLTAISAAAYAADSSAGVKTLRVVMKYPDGTPIPKDKILEFHCRDLDDEALYTPITREDGAAVVTMPDKPFQVSTIFKVPGFGEVAVYADNKGKGYTKPGTIDFVTDAAATRLLRVKTTLKHAEDGGVKLSKEFYRKMTEAEKAEPYKSLAITLAAGEELTLARANHRISKYDGPRKDFFFGCNSMGPDRHNEEFDKMWLNLFNFSTFNLYMGSYATGETTRDYERPDWQYNWLVQNGVKQIKPCPPIYMAKSVTPQWMLTKTWPELQKILPDLVYEVCTRYKDHADYCEIVNEAHDTSNMLRLSQSQLTETAVLSSKAARAADSKVQRLINSCHIWGEYVANLGKDGTVKRSPYKYMQDCIKAGCEFEIVGLQLYYPERDLFEIERTFDHYATLGKPIHITEIECGSAPGLSPTSARKKAPTGWHGDWSEQMQADWAEAIYTIAYSKPYMKVVAWWSLKDGGEFWPWGGLLHTDNTPKPAYNRLKALQEKWGYDPAALREKK
jgi:GH35 family endo-1,4-beta-xylanase